MNSFSWTVRQFLRQLIPFAVVGAIAYGGYTLYKEGAFRRGVGPAIGHMLGKLPYFGSRFKHYVKPSSHHGYRSRKGVASRGGKRHKRHFRSHRRHGRRYR